MKHDLQISILKELLRQLEEDRNVDAGRQFKMSTEAYACPEIADREWKEFFQNTPQLIGLAGRLPKNGSFFTCDDFGIPVLATRGKDGKFRAFLNVCRHRAVRLVGATNGEQLKFSCRFHAWTYSNDGQLIGVPREHDFGTVDKSCMGLTELPSEELNGMLWVHPQPDGILDLKKFLGPLLDEISDNPYEEMVYVGESVIERDLNWKLANDTFGETYHFEVLHKNTLSNIFYGNNLSYQELGLHHRFVFASRTIDKIRERPVEEWNLSTVTSLLYYIFPNIQFTQGGDSQSLIKMYPVAGKPGRSLTRIDHYYHPNALAAIEETKAKGGEVLSAETAYERRQSDAPNVALDLSGLTEIFDSTIEKEDYEMGVQQQANIETGVVREVIFGRNEPALHHYHRNFRELLGLSPLEEVPV